MGTAVRLLHFGSSFTNFVLGASDTERPSSTFQHIGHVLVHCGILEGTGAVRDRVAVALVHAGMDNLVRVTDDSKVGVVSDNEDLPTTTRLFDTLDKHFGDGMVGRDARRLAAPARVRGAGQARRRRP